MSWFKNHDIHSRILFKRWFLKSARRKRSNLQQPLSRLLKLKDFGKKSPFELIENPLPLSAMAATSRPPNCERLLWTALTILTTLFVIVKFLIWFNDLICLCWETCAFYCCELLFTEGYQACRLQKQLLQFLC